MATRDWDWKPRDGKRGGLLYQSGNWGDLLKLLWLTEVVRWKASAGVEVDYFDPFAGAAEYPLDRKTRFRFERAALASLSYIKRDFIDRDAWPSSASAVALLNPARMTVFDADAGRRREWKETGGPTVAEGDSGWAILAAREALAQAVWLVDPYDFLAEWREYLPVIVKKAETGSILLYIYNRSARSDEAFRNYKAFRNALADLRGDAPCRLGRAAADVFLPRSHHEMLLLPGAADAVRSDFAELSGALEAQTLDLAAAMDRAAAFDA